MNNKNVILGFACKCEGGAIKCTNKHHTMFTHVDTCLYVRIKPLWFKSRITILEDMTKEEVKDFNNQGSYTHTEMLKALREEYIFKRLRIENDRERPI